MARFPPLPVPVFKDSSVCVSVVEGQLGKQMKDTLPDDEWAQMEAELYEEGYNKSPIMGRRTQKGSAGLQTGGKTSCAVGGEFRKRVASVYRRFLSALFYRTCFRES